MRFVVDSKQRGLGFDPGLADRVFGGCSLITLLVEMGDEQTNKDYKRKCKNYIIIIVLSLLSFSKIHMTTLNKALVIRNY